MTGFVLLRARAHRLLLGAALLTVLLTTTVLAALTAYTGALGDAALRHTLASAENAAGTALVVEADTPAPDRRAAADSAVRDGARRTFDGLPVTLRTLVRSGPYALPGSLRPDSARSDDDRGDRPDLTHLAALDLSQVRTTGGRLPRAGRNDAAGEIEVALPQAAAGPLGLEPGARLLLTDRFGGPSVHVRVTGLYRPARASAAYWELDELGGRGVHTRSFTTYGPLLADPSVFDGDRVSAGRSAWLASADFSTMTTDRIGALRQAAHDGPEALMASGAPDGTTAAATVLPEVLDRVERSLLVSRSTLLVVALLLVLLAGYALLLVARLLTAERAAETRLMRARGGSPGRIAGLAAWESLLLAVPAAGCAPLLAGPLAGLLAGQGAPARIGLRPDTSGAASEVWLVAAATALGCALAVTVPALASGSFSVRRARALPGPVRAGADIGLLVLAAVAYWQLRTRTGGTAPGGSGVDPLLVTAPALALFAGTVLTLRLLPPVARLAERRAARGRGLPAALASARFGRRPARAAGPVLLLVLAVALGTLAIGEGASWSRSQDDQADFRAGTDVRVLGTGAEGPGRSGLLGALDGVRASAPAVRTDLPLPGDRTATVLALDTERAAEGLLLRRDLAAEPARSWPAVLAPQDATSGMPLPERTAGLRATLRLVSDRADGSPADVTVTLEDRHGVPYPVPLGELPADGRPHDLTLDLELGLGLAGATGAPAGRAAEPLTLTALQLDVAQPVGRSARHRLTVRELTAVAADGRETPLPVPDAWTAVSRTVGGPAFPDAPAVPVPARVETSPPGPLVVGYGTGHVPRDEPWVAGSVTVRLAVARPEPTEVTGIATDRFLESAGIARTGQRVDVSFGGSTVPVRVVRTVRALPATATGGAGDGGALLVDLRSVNRVLQARHWSGAEPTEWWLRTAPGAAAEVAAQVRAWPHVEPSRVVVRDEIAERLRDDPFGAGPEAAFAAAAVAAALLAAVGFAVSAAGSLRERSGEFAVLRALGAPRRLIARTVAVELGLLTALALTVGVVLGAVLTRAVIPLIVLTPEAVRPVPEVLVELPVSRVALLVAAVAVAPLVVTGVLAARRAGTTGDALRRQGGE